MHSHFFSVEVHIHPRNWFCVYAVPACWNGDHYYYTFRYSFSNRLTRTRFSFVAIHRKYVDFVCVVNKSEKIYAGCTVTESDGHST